MNKGILRAVLSMLVLVALLGSCGGEESGSGDSGSDAVATDSTVDDTATDDTTSTDAADSSGEDSDASRDSGEIALEDQPDGEFYAISWNESIDPEPEGFLAGAAVLRQWDIQPTCSADDCGITITTSRPSDYPAPDNPPPDPEPFELEYSDGHYRGERTADSNCTVDGKPTETGTMETVNTYDLEWDPDAEQFFGTRSQISTPTDAGSEAGCTKRSAEGKVIVAKSDAALPAKEFESEFINSGAVVDGDQVTLSQTPVGTEATYLVNPWTFTFDCSTGTCAVGAAHVVPPEGPDLVTYPLVPKGDGFSGTSSEYTDDCFSNTDPDKVIAPDGYKDTVDLTVRILADVDGGPAVMIGKSHSVGTSTPEAKAASAVDCPDQFSDHYEIFVRKDLVDA